MIIVIQRQLKDECVSDVLAYKLYDYTKQSGLTFSCQMCDYISQLITYCTYVHDIKLQHFGKISGHFESNRYCQVGPTD